MAVPNTQDNTQLGTGEQISNEAIGVNESKRDQNLPIARQYKIPRSKIAVGPYGQDWGDASATIPFNVESYRERQLAEAAYLAQFANAIPSKYTISGEGKRDTVTYDLRGRFLETRGVR